MMLRKEMVCGSMSTFKIEEFSPRIKTKDFILRIPARLKKIFKITKEKYLFPYMEKGLV